MQKLQNQAVEFAYKALAFRDLAKWIEVLGIADLVESAQASIMNPITSYETHPGFGQYWSRFGGVNVTLTFLEEEKDMVRQQLLGEHMDYDFNFQKSHFVSEVYYSNLSGNVLVDRWFHDEGDGLQFIVQFCSPVEEGQVVGDNCYVRSEPTEPKERLVVVCEKEDKDEDTVS